MAINPDPAASEPIDPNPIVILVEPQLGENIGMCARAMLNCGLETLRLVDPRDGWPSEPARRAAADADLVVERAEVFESVSAAVADCHRVLATSARKRSLPLPVWNADDAASRMRIAVGEGERVAVLFGPEASGLDNEAMARADAVIRFSTNPAFSSLNLAQCVLLFGWEWRRANLGARTGQREASPPKPAVETDIAARAGLETFVERLGTELDARGFFLTPEQKPNALRTLRSLFSRSRPTEREINFLHGMLTALTKRDPEV
ncbi:MAG: TrmH family RNA methyltransferase [Verrucomicrobiales bacterium]